MRFCPTGILTLFFLFFLQVHQKQTERMKHRSEWFLSDPTGLVTIKCRPDRPSSLGPAAIAAASPSTAAGGGNHHVSSSQVPSPAVSSSSGAPPVNPSPNARRPGPQRTSTPRTHLPSSPSPRGGGGGGSSSGVVKQIISKLPPQHPVCDILKSSTTATTASSTATTAAASSSSSSSSPSGSSPSVSSPQQQQQQFSPGLPKGDGRNFLSSTVSWMSLLEEKFRRAK